MVKEMKMFISLCHHGDSSATSERLLVKKEVAFSDNLSQSHVKGQICTNLEVIIILLLIIISGIFTYKITKHMMWSAHPGKTKSTRKYTNLTILGILL